MPPTFTSVETLAAGIASEGTSRADKIETLISALAPFVGLGVGAAKYDTLCKEVARLRVIGDDATDPLPGLSEG